VLNLIFSRKDQRITAYDGEDIVASYEARHAHFSGYNGEGQAYESLPVVAIQQSPTNRQPRTVTNTAHSTLSQAMQGAGIFTAAVVDSMNRNRPGRAGTQRWAAFGCRTRTAKRSVG
jgi:hypothetical protein